MVIDFDTLLLDNVQFKPYGTESLPSDPDVKELKEQFLLMHCISLDKHTSSWVNEFERVE